MDKIAKALKRLTLKEKRAIEAILILIESREFKSLDIKALKGHKNIYRVRRGSIRILFEIDKNQKIYILGLERRSKKTYKF